MTKIKLLNEEKVVTRIIYKELRLYLERAENDYDDKSLYLTKDNEVYKYVIGYRPAETIFKVNNCVVNLNEPTPLLENDWYVVASNLDGYSSHRVCQKAEGEYLEGRDSRYRLKIVAGDLLGTALPQEVLEAIVSEDDEKGNRIKPIVVGYKVVVYGNDVSQEIITNVDGTLHCMTKVQYQNLKYS